MLEQALAIFGRLADAEALVHGVDVDAVEFHEVGAWDSIADIVGAAYLIDAVGAARWTVSAAPLGSGRVMTAHGTIPVPAPATALLLKGFHTIDDGIAGERVPPNWLIYSGMALGRAESCLRPLQLRCTPPENGA